MAPEQKVQDPATTEEPLIHGDLLEAILSQVPLIDLVPASHVSKSWNHAVASSLAHVNPIKPWLMVYTQNNRPPYVTTAHAYDPRSHVWLEISRPPIQYVSALRSSHSTLLYMLSPTRFAFSYDPLHLTWHFVDAPLVWRTDPIVAMVGQCVVVAGGSCDFEDDPLAVEIYNMKTRKWDRCDSMPSILKDSSASTWLSVAVDQQRMHVTERNSGLTYSFYPDSKIWYGPYDLRPDQSVNSCFIGSLKGRVVMAGLVCDAENVKGVKLWEVRGDSKLEYWRELGEMPEEMAKKMKGERGGLASLSVSWMGECVYIENPWDARELIVCEVDGNGACQWRSMRNVVVNDDTQMQRLVLTCSNVKLEDLQRAMAMRTEKTRLRLVVKDRD